MKLGGILQDVLRHRVANIEAGRLRLLLAQIVFRLTPDQTADRRLDILRKTESLWRLPARGSRDRSTLLSAWRNSRRISCRYTG